MNDSDEELWAIIANVKKQIPYGPGGKQLKSGLRKFKSGAKLHIIGSYPGTCSDIVAIGQHRDSGKYIRCVIRASAIENMRLKVIYSKSVLELLKDYQAEGALITTKKEDAELLMKNIPVWANS